MFESDTIAAISTPLGEGGIGIVRLSGPGSFGIAEKIFHSPKGRLISSAPSHTILYGHIRDASGHIVDEVLASVMRAPRTYTREDVVEIHCHGGMLPLRKTLELVLEHGARLAQPGEFTQRAFMNGRIDLVQAEAVMDIIKAKTDEGRRIAMEQLSGGLSEAITAVRDRLTELCAHVEAYLDFPEEEIEIATEKEILEGIEGLSTQLGRLADTYEGGRFFREGFSIAIVGKPNVGKSSLLNALLERDRAIVTDIPGTTRDTIEEYLNIRGLPVRIMDTAGIRESHDLPEQEGVSRSLRAIEGADLVIGLFDASAVVSHEDREVVERIKGKKAISVLNKTDLPEMFDPALCSGPVVKVSALYRRGIDELKEEILDQAMRGKGEHKEGVVVTNIRHKTLVELAREALGRAREEMMNHSPLEITAIHLRDALQRLGEIVGIVTTDDILNKIFSDFCIGK